MSEKDFEKLFKGQFSSLCKLAFTMVKNADISKDIVQQVFIKLWDKRQKLTIRGPIEAYLYRMVINTTLNHIEKEKRYKQWEHHSAQNIELAIETEENKDVIEDKENKIKTAIAELPAKCQAVFLLSRFENLSNKEIAKHLDISVKAVEKHITLALKKLRIKLKPLFNQGVDTLIIFLMIYFLIEQVGILIIHLS